MHKAGIIRGDGIGPAIAEAAQRVLEAGGAQIAWREISAGQRTLDRCGSELPAESIEIMRRLPVVLKAPLIAPVAGGGVSIETNGEPRHYPSINNALRRELGHFVNVRPVRGWHPISGAHADVDLVIVREVTEDIYSGIERQVNADCAEAVKRVTRAASVRVARFACDYALRHGRRRLTAVHKANVLHLTDGLFLDSVRRAASACPGLSFDDKMIDATCYLLVKAPQQFDILLAPNQYGDILSDLAAGLVGSLGLAPGANFGDGTAMFEAAHGAAPDIAAQGTANPIALVLSGAMLLDHLNEPETAGRVRDAVASVLADGRILTPDLGGRATTREMTAALCAAVQAPSRRAVEIHA